MVSIKNVSIILKQWIDFRKQEKRK